MDIKKEEKLPMGGQFTSGVNIGNGVQLHFHGPDSTTITGSYFKILENGEPAKDKGGTPIIFDGYESAMADYYAHKLDLNRFTKRSSESN